jgi:hypothetical protein
MTNDGDIITLKDAAQHFGLSVYALRTEANNGRLTIYRVGKRFYTTPGDIKEMFRQCRVEQKAPDSISIRSARSSQSETDRLSSAQAAASEIAQRLKSSSRNTLGTSISLSRRARP